jgi:hypothetical protein
MSDLTLFAASYNLFVFFDVGEYEMMKYLLDESSLVLTFGTSMIFVESNTNLERRQVVTLDKLGL